MKYIRKFFPDRESILGLAFWAAVLFFGWWYYYPALPSFTDGPSRISKPQTQGSNIKDQIEHRVAAAKIVSRMPFQGRCNQPGMIFQFAVKGIINIYSDGNLVNTGEVLEQQDVFTKYRYTPPDRIVLDLKDWLAAGKPAARFSVPAIGEYELEVEVDVMRVRDVDEVENDTEIASAIHEIELDCEVDIAPAAAAQNPTKATLDTCWDEWAEKSLEVIPKPGDTHDPRTGKLLSQTPGAERTRALKFQAAKDALQLRGKESAEWQMFLKTCVAR
jgi:hypothetical protein